MIYAIGIYTTNESCSVFKKQQRCPESKPGLFESSPFAALETQTLPILTAKAALEKVDNKIFFEKTERENHYFLKIIDGSEHIIISMATKTRFETSELHYLFQNINKVRTGRAKNTTLADILLNPLGYTARDVQMAEISQELAVVKAEMNKNIDLLITRGEDLDRIKQSALDLNAGVVKFHKKAADLNYSCVNVYGCKY